MPVQTHTHKLDIFLARAHQVGPFTLQNNRMCTGLLIVEIPVLVQNYLQHLQPACFSAPTITQLTLRMPWLGTLLCMWLCHTYHSDRCRALHCTVRGPDLHSACFDAEVLWVFSVYVLLQLNMFLVTTTLFSVTLTTATTFFNLINLQYSTISEFCTGDTCQAMTACNT